MIADLADHRMIRVLRDDELLAPQDKNNNNPSHGIPEHDKLLDKQDEKNQTVRMRDVTKLNKIRLNITKIRKIVKKYYGMGGNHSRSKQEVKEKF